MQLKSLVPSTVRPAAANAYRFARIQYDRYVYERPSTAYRRQVARRATVPGFLDYANTLCATGGVVIPRFFEEEKLRGLQEEFERLVQTNPIDPRSAAVSKVHIAESRIHESRLFSELVFEPNLLALVEYYWGKPVVLHGGGGTRSEPADVPDHGSNQWHHDGKRKQVRFFVFLTDVPEDGQGTKFVPGSHRIFHTDISDSRLVAEDVERFGRAVSCAGPAGSVALIDTNVFHRATRNTESRRDIWSYAYRAPNPLTTPLNPAPALHPDVTKELNAEQRRVARLD